MWNISRFSKSKCSIEIISSLLFFASFNSLHSSAFTTTMVCIQPVVGTRLPLGNGRWTVYWVEMENDKYNLFLKRLEYVDRECGVCDTVKANCVSARVWNAAMNRALAVCVCVPAITEMNAAFGESWSSATIICTNFTIYFCWNFDIVYSTGCQRTE